jgi:uncharacterized phage-associated protein
VPVPVSAHDVAHEIRSRLPGVDRLKVHKFLYYCQAWHLTWTGEPLFTEPVKAWDSGPVVAALWSDEEYGERPEPARALEGEQSSVVDYVVGRYGQLSGRDLVALTHHEDPWRETYAAGRAARNAVISHEAMRRFFEDDESWRDRQARAQAQAPARSR